MKCIIKSILLALLAISIASANTPEPLIYFTFDGDVNNYGTAVPDAGWFKDNGASEPNYSCDAVRGLCLDQSHYNWNEIADAVVLGQDGPNETPMEAAVEGLVSFTIMGFFKYDTSPPAGANIFYRAKNGSGYAYRLYFQNSYQSLTLIVDNKSAYSSYLTYAEKNIWIFFAVTYDSTKVSDNVKWYKTWYTYPGQYPSRVIEGWTNTISSATSTSDNDSLIAVWGDGTNQAKGYFDEFRFFGSTTDNTGALTLEQIQYYFEKAYEIPEEYPSNYDPIEFDLNDDQIVNLVDLASFACHWLEDNRP